MHATVEIIPIFLTLGVQRSTSEGLARTDSTCMFNFYITVEKFNNHSSILTTHLLYVTLLVYLNILIFRRKVLTRYLNIYHSWVVEKSIERVTIRSVYTLTFQNIFRVLYFVSPFVRGDVFYTSVLVLFQENESILL